MNNIIKKYENEMSKVQCVNCRRILEFTDNDEYRCKYHLTSIYEKRSKCKYFKRHVKYITCNAIGKIRAYYKKGYVEKTQYKQGKFIKDIVK